MSKLGEAMQALEGMPRDMALDICAAFIYRMALSRSGGNQCKAAEALGCHRNTLNRELKRLGIPEKLYKKPSSAERLRRAEAAQHG